MLSWHVIFSLTAALSSCSNQCHSATCDILHFAVSCLNVHQETPWKQSIKSGNTQGCKLPHCEAHWVWLHPYFSWSKLSVHFRETAAPSLSYCEHWIMPWALQQDIQTVQMNKLLRYYCKEHFLICLHHWNHGT